MNNIVSFSLGALMVLCLGATRVINNGDGTGTVINSENGPAVTITNNALYAVRHPESKRESLSEYESRLRDEFAMSAMNGMLMNREDWGKTNIPFRAYQFADSMMQERARTTK